MEPQVETEFCLFYLDPTNKSPNLTTPPLLLRLPLTSTLSPHLLSIDQHYRPYISSLMSRDSMHVFGPFCAIDPDIPLYMYFDGTANRLPIFTVKYEPSIVLSESKMTWRKRGRVVMVREGRKVDIEGEPEQKIGELISKAKLGKGVCYIGRKRIPQASRIKDLEQHKIDTNLYIRIDPQ